MRVLFRLAAAVCGSVAILMLVTTGVIAQTTVPPLRGDKTESMGQPQRWKPYIGPSLIWDRRDPSQGGLQLFGGVYRDILGAAVGGLGIAGEAYYAYVGGENNGGFRVLGVVPFFGLQLGTDYNFENSDWNFILSFQFPWRRSGPLNRGDAFRIDYYPTLDHSFAFGLSIPVFQRWAGKTRPQRDSVELPEKPTLYDLVYEPPAEIQKSLGIVRQASININSFTTPFLDMDAETDEAHMEIFLEDLHAAKAFIDSTDENFPNGHTFTAEIEVYHRELERAFVMAAGVGEVHGKKVANEARRILRDEVVFPYNRLLGQRKRRDSLLGYGMRAEEVFSAWLFTSSDVPPTNHMAVLYVFGQLIKYWDDNRYQEKRSWGDSRLVWIPLHYVIKLDETDTQEELNAIIEAAVDHKFTHANDVHYIINELFQPEVYRMIHQARDYHVLWIHDYRGKNSQGKPDKIGYAQTVDAYLAALTDRVREYEKTRKIPVFMIFLDQIYYEANDGRLWLTLLEDPLDHKVDLPSGYEEWEEHIKDTQQKLREAVEASPTLQAGKARYGEAWLKNKIKVNVNNTNIADMSFRSNYLFGWVPFVPDVLLRDHRKISFRDITELDPAQGEAIFTGMGIGEHYAGPTWDDRAILVRGPALVHLKDEARALLLTQGFKEHEIPVPLRSLPTPDDYEERLARLRAGGWTTSAMQVHNSTGYGMKWSNMLKGTLYNLMPRGTIMIIPDSLWNSFLWGGMMAGAALRGCWVFPISPALANAPSSGMPQMARANELFTRLILLQQHMKPEIEEAGGMFHAGIYDAHYDVGDAFANVQDFNRGAAQSELYRKVFPFDQSVFDLIASFEDSLHASGWEPAYLSEDVEERKPKLHLKTQFFASGDAIQSLVPLKEWAPVVDSYMRSRAEQVRIRDNYVSAKSLRKGLSEAARPLAERWYNETTPEQREKSFFFLTVGSHNMDYRGKFMDGEVSVIVAGEQALIAYLDFASIAAKTTWVESIEQLDELLPAVKGRARWFSRFIKNAL
jgi:phosphatidylserine/phosphatidylglycerophosphate/cardiolipin synthase-like enzyme